jgi:tyrosinase
LQRKPPLTSSIAPGAKSKFDDFVVVHILQTGINHDSVSSLMFFPLSRRLTEHSQTYFLPWHRYYLHHYEQALRTECGYKGYQPYWNWGRYAADPASSPVFNGDDFSMSGDGLPIPHKGIDVPGTPKEFSVIPPGNGGGCITSGPFKK